MSCANGAHVMSDSSKMVCDCGEVRFSSTTSHPVKVVVGPMEIFEAIRSRAETILRTTFMESGRAWDEDVFKKLLNPVLGIGIAAASEHYAEHPEHLALAGTPICNRCREPIQTLQLGVDPARNSDDGEIVRIAWPCGHYQGTS